MMQDLRTFLCYVAVMAGVTYLIRMLPLAIFQKKIENIYIRSFLFYVPYAVLSAMTFPAIFTSTGSLPTALAGLAVALVLAWNNRSLLTVAVAACCGVLLAQGALYLWLW